MESPESEETRGIPVVAVAVQELGEGDRVRLPQHGEAMLRQGPFDEPQLLTDVMGCIDMIPR